MKIILTGTDITTACSGLREARENFPKNSLEQQMLTATLEKLQDLNTLDDYLLEAISNPSEDCGDLRYAYFAKHVEGFWVTVSTDCTGEATIFFDKHFTAKNGYIRTKITELD